MIIWTLSQENLTLLHANYKGQGLFQQFWEKAPVKNWEKKIDLTSKLGEINDIEYYKGSKIYPLNQVILDCTT